MTKSRSIAVAVIALLAAAPAAAAGGPVIVTILPGNGPAKGCYNPRLPQNPEWVAKAAERADIALGQYLAIMRVRGSLKKLFPEKKSWALDDSRMNAADAVDPWADRVQRTERTNLIVSNVGRWWFRAVWNAYDANGRLLGRYDAAIQRGPNSALFEDLHLFSPSSTAKAEPLTPFCRYPGDIEASQEAQREREAKKAARRASNQ